jgi:5'-3' exonuclease
MSANQTPLALIDADMMCYRACRPRPEELVGNMPYDDDGVRIYPTFTKKEDAAYFGASWKNLKSDIGRLLDNLYTADYLMAVKSPTNFRDDMYPDYKKQRKPSNINFQTSQKRFSQPLRELLVMEGYAMWAHDREADDLLRIWSRESRSVGRESIICSGDKDLLCVRNEHYLLREKEFVTISRIEGNQRFYTQLLMGDRVDNIPGLQGCGPKTAEKALDGITDEEEMQEIVISMYLEKHGEDDWFEYLTSNGKMLYLQRSLNDYFDCRKWGLVKELLG